MLSQERRSERRLDELDEQMQQWSGVVALARRKDELWARSPAAHGSSSADVQDADEEEEEEDIEQFLDWRTKRAWK